MADEKTNTPDLSTEKLHLEIEELKIKIDDLKKPRVWNNYVQPIIPVVVTLMIGIWGSFLTCNYNKAQINNATTQLELAKAKNKSDSELSSTQLRISQEKNLSDSEIAKTQLDINLSKNESDKAVALLQREIAKRKNESDKSIAQINASLTYVKLLKDIEKEDTILRNQALNIIAPALPPGMSFPIACEDLPNNTDFLELLLKEYTEDSWQYLAKFLEALSPTKQEELIYFLNNKKYLPSFLNYLISIYDSKNKTTLISICLHWSVNKENPYPEIKRLISEAKSDKQKGYISKAAALVFCDPSYSITDNWDVLNTAAQYFWEDYNIARGESPDEGSVDQNIYHNKFHIPISYHDSLIDIPATDVLAQSLYHKLIALNYNSLSVFSIERILYSYSEISPRYSKNVFTPYLNSSMSYQVVMKILRSLNTKQRKKDFANYLGSLSGDILFSNISQDRLIGKQYAELMISWYRSNWYSDWAIPKFFGAVINVYPELKAKISKKWG